ncbi:hypothetical protein N3K66_000920 [Trichothecium roseum]|uniref:Uncharacterized protein n=1 Tax=Trichothecium roseum TaxID=47278 RepID=A0ACC0VD54_9HYPO|nr:hypothetical protein N3K66_000920 [Trichothecium roseum]
MCIWVMKCRWIRCGCITTERAERVCTSKCSEELVVNGGPWHGWCPEHWDPDDNTDSGRTTWDEEIEDDHFDMLRQESLRLQQQANHVANANNGESSKNNA